jgi:hypothetical protein
MLFMSWLKWVDGNVAINSVYACKIYDNSSYVSQVILRGHI